MAALYLTKDNGNGRYKLCKEFNFMDEKEIIALIKKVGQEQNGYVNSDGEYVDFCKGDEEYVFDNEDVKELAEKLIKLFSLHLVSGSLKHTMTLGVTPVTMFENSKPNYQILNINYNVSDGKGDYVRVTLEVGGKVDVIEISTQEAVHLGFINPYGLKEYCLHH